MPFRLRPPFKGRESHDLDAFEAGAIQALRQDPKTPVVEVSGSIFDSNIRMAGPVVMGAPCVSCHNAHPWPEKGLEGRRRARHPEISVAQPIAANLLSFKYLLLYFLLMRLIGIAFIMLQRRQQAIAGATAN